MGTIVKEIWVQDIADNLFPDDSFIMRSIDDSAFADANGVVNLPQAGAKPNTEKNRSTYPATVSGRADSNATYLLDEFSTDPTRVRRLEELEVSYAKRMSVLRNHLLSLQQKIHQDILFNWGAELPTHIIRTSGDSRPANANGATGNRKKVTLDDIRSARKRLVKDDVGITGLVMLVPAEMEEDILGIPEVIDASKFGGANLPNGVVARLLGFDIYVRSASLEYDNAALPVKQAFGTSDVALNSSILCWNENFVRRAVGTINVYQDLDRADHYGDVFSTDARAGGRKAYGTGLGVVSIVEAHA